VLAYGKDPWLRGGKGRHHDHIVMVADRKGITGHPAPKPIEVWKWLLERGSVSPRDHILDPFVGSGTTIIAAEMTGRACHAIEISPAYCDVALLRWQAFTGQTATHALTGRSFADTAAERAPQPAEAA
jgi:DNA modification methylase